MHPMRGAGSDELVDAEPEIANRALDVLEHENRVREEIQRGSTLSRVQKLERWERVG